MKNQRFGNNSQFGKPSRSERLWYCVLMAIFNGWLWHEALTRTDEKAVWVFLLAGASSILYAIVLMSYYKWLRSMVWTILMILAIVKFLK